jgi:hypothetical protein
MNEATFLPRDRLAVFVDGDNLSPDLAPQLLKQIGGTADVMRVYAAGPHLKGWLKHEAFEPRVTKFEGASQKNLTDLTLSLDALHLSLTQNFARVVLATSDGDFAVLARKLRETGVTVIGIGDEKAPNLLRRSCTRFVAISHPIHGPEPQRACASRDPILRAALGLTGPDWKPVTAVAQELKEKHGLTRKSEGVGQWSRWFKARADRFDVDEASPGIRVRQKAERQAGKGEPQCASAPSPLPNRADTLSTTGSST